MSSKPIIKPKIKPVIKPKIKPVIHQTSSGGQSQPKPKQKANKRPLLPWRQPKKKLDESVKEATTGDVDEDDMPLSNIREIYQPKTATTLGKDLMGQPNILSGSSKGKEIMGQPNIRDKLPLRRGNGITINEPSDTMAQTNAASRKQNKVVKPSNLSQPLPTSKDKKQIKPKTNTQPSPRAKAKKRALEQEGERKSDRLLIMKTFKFKNTEDAPIDLAGEK